MPATVLRQVQLGKEGLATWGGGTGIKPTVRLIGVTDASLQIADEVYQPESLGYLMPSIQAAQVGLSASGSVQQDISYQDICYWLDGVFGPAVGSKLAGTQYIYKYVAGTSAIPTPRSYTVGYGADNAEYRALGMLPSDVELSVEAGQVWKSTVTLLGKSVTTKALNNTLTIRTVQLIRGADTALSVGAWANSTYTAVTATLISANLKVSNGRHLKTFLGALAPGATGGGRWTGQLVTVMEFNSSAKGYVEALLTGTVQRRIKIASATTTPLRALDVYFAGTLVEGATLFTDRDGNMTVSLTWNGTYSSTLANWLKIDATNELVTTP
jgi:hypothetical protein